MAIKSRKEDIAEKIIEAEIQKAGERIAESVPDYPEIQTSPEEIQREFQEILKKSEAYEKLTEGSLSFEEEERGQVRRKLSTLAKVAVIFVVAGACLFGLSMRSEATRMWWLDSMSKIVGQDRREAVNNDENRVISATTEDDAREEIMKNTGIPMPGMAYRPKGLSFDGYSFDKAACFGELYYWYNEYVICMYGFSADEDKAYYKVQDGEIISEKIVETSYGLANIMEIYSEGDEISSIMAEWTYQNHQYQFTGKISVAEAEKIIKNIFY